MRGLLVPAIDEPSNADKPVDDKKKQEQLNADIAEGSSSIKVSISQDNILMKSPQHKRPQQRSDKRPDAGPTSNYIIKSLSSFTEKDTSKKSRKGNRLAKNSSHW